ncbi:MAG: hypothetical protein JTJ28_08055 [Lactobacillus sp.]|nr:hypothetical protein [Lactobacillus sp.]
MWIRSQDRKILTEIHNLDIDDINQIWDGSSLLGKYSSEEKALKVLDEIQICIMTEHQFFTEDVNCIGKYFTKEWKEIYQMPADEDVEV